MLAILQKGSPSQFEADFKSKDEIAGQVNIAESEFETGKPFVKACGKLDIDIPSLKTYMVHYVHAPYVQHSTQLLPDAKLPAREVQDFAIYHINRRFMRGEEAIKLVERVLGVDASADPIYNFSSAQNRSG